MNKNLNRNSNPITKEQALEAALRCAGLGAGEALCLHSRCEDGLYHLLVRSAYLQHEFYVDAASGEVLGLDTAPLSYREMLRFCADAEREAPAAA